MEDDGLHLLNVPGRGATSQTAEAGIGKKNEAVNALRKAVTTHSFSCGVETNHTMHRRKKHCKRKKVIRKNGKRYYRQGKSGLKRLRGNAKPPKRRC